MAVRFGSYTPASIARFKFRTSLFFASFEIWERELILAVYTHLYRLALASFTIALMLSGLPFPAFSKSNTGDDSETTIGQIPAFIEQTRARSPEAPSDYRTEIVASGLKRPWSMAFLPDGRFLISERAGQLRLVDVEGSTSSPITGLPEIRNTALGGFLDVVLDPEYASNGRFYFTFVEPRGETFGLSVGSATLNLENSQPTISDVRVVFRAVPEIGEDTNLGGRMALGRDRLLYIAIGDRFRGTEAQSLTSHLGKIIRIALDGTIPPDNPNPAGLRPEIYAWGVRNPLGLAIDAAGQLWEVENGARGGDELNLIKPGANYGWPFIAYGRYYDGQVIGTGTAQEGMVQPIYYWDPSIAVSGMMIYDGVLFPDWNGNIFVAALRGQHLSRLSFRDNRIVEEEKLLTEIKVRLRDVRGGPDGGIYVLTDEDDAKILRITPNLVSRAVQPAR